MSKNAYLAIISSMLCCAMPLGFSLPSHPQVCFGTAEVEHIDSHTMQITPSHQAILHYQDFQIGAQEKVRFIQDSSKSCVLNRITGENPSQILGSLESNGKVFLVNPNGIYFGADSKVNVGSLIASTLDIADEDFLQETYRFSLSQGNNSSIVNEGYLHSAEGSIVLLAPQIHNLGHIQAQAGSVLLASGEHVTLDFTGDGLIQFSVEGSLKEALIEHLGKIEGSIVSMKLPVAKRAITEILNMDGADEAEVFIEENGVIKFAASSQIKAKKVFAEGSQISVLGSIDASSALDKGGEVHLFGKDIFLEGAKIDASGLIGAGEVLIGGEFQGKGKTPYASTVFMDETSQIFADSIERGKGGLVVLWSQDHTVFDGKIFAKGGSLGGDGGLVETSSKDNLQVVSGRVDTASSSGKMGEWLLDPDYVFIGTGGCTSAGWSSCGSGPNYVNCGSTPCQISIDSIESSSSNVSIQSYYGVTVCGDITMATNANLTFTICSGTLETNLSLYGNVTMLGGDFTVGDGVFLYLNQGTTIITNGGDINLYYVTSNGPGPTYGLTMNAGAGNIIMQSSLLTSINVVAATNIYVYSNLYNIGSGGITFPASSTYIPLTNSILYSASGPISIGSIQGSTPGGQSVTLSAPTVSIAGSVGDSTSLASFTLSSITSNVTPISPSVITQWPSTLVANTIKFNPAISGSGSTPTIAISSGQTANLTGNVTFSCPVDGPGSLSLSGGTLTFTGAIGGNTALDDFTLASGTVASWPSITATGNISITPSITINTSINFTSSGGAAQFFGNITGTGSLTLNEPVSFANTSTLSLANFTLSEGSITSWPSSITATGALTFTPAVLINSGAVPSLTGSTITFSSTLDGPGGVALNGGTITFGGAVGGASNLSSFSLNSGTLASWPNISTSGNISITPAVTINNSPTFTSSGGAIQFSGNIGGTGNLILNGAANFANTLSLANFTLSSGSITSWPSSMTATGALTFTPAVSINSGAVPSLTGSTIIFSSTLDGPGGIALNEGTITFGGAVGGISPLSSFSLGSGTIASWPNISTTGNISLFPAVTINNFPAFTSSGGTIQFSDSITGTGSLTLNGTASFASTLSLGNFTLSSGSITSWPSSMTATGALTFTPAVSILSGETPSLTGSTITFSSTLDGPGGVALNGGTISFGGVVGGGTNLSIFTLNSGSVASWPNISTTGNISLIPAVTINNSPTFTSSGGIIAFVNDLDGPGSLTLNGNSGSVTFSGAVGSNTALSSLVINSGSSVTFSSTLNGATAITIGGITNGVTFTGAVGGNVALSSLQVTSTNGPIAFANTLDASGPVTINGNSGSVTFSGAVGSNTALSSLVINSGSSVTFSNTLNGATAVTIGGITNGVTFTGAVGGNVALSSLQVTSTNGPIAFADTLDASGSVTINGNSGSVTFSGAVGSNTALSSLVINSGSGASFASNVLAGTISITPIAIFTGTCNVTGLTSIAFGNVVNGPGSLTLTGGTISLSGVVGDNPPLASFTLASGSITAWPSSINTTNALTLTPSVTLSGSLSLNSINGPIATNAIDGSSVGGQSLTINAGTGSFSVGDLGTGTALGQVQLTSTLSSFIESIITSSQSITVNASTSQIQNNLFPTTFLTANSLIDSTNAGASSGASIFLGPIGANSIGASAQTLTINATSTAGATAVITLYGEIGDQPLGALTIQGTPSSSTPQVYIAGSIYTNSIAGGAGGAITIDPQITLTGPSIMSTISANSSGAPIVLNDLYANNLQSLSLFSGSGFISTGDLGSSSYPLSSISLTGGAITLNGPVNASGSIGSMSIINSGALTIQSGAITLSGSFTQQGNGAVTLGNNITANGGILSLQSIVSLTQPITLTSSSDLTLSSQVTSSVSSGLTLSSTGGAIYAAQLGTTGNPLGAVTFTANGLSSLAGIVTNNGAIDIRPPILLTSQPTVLDTTAGTSSGFVRFQNTVDATNTGSLAEALQIVTEGSSVTFDAALGGNAPLGGLDISSTGSVTIGGSIFTTSTSTSSLAGAIQINGPVTLSGDFLATIEIDTTEGGGAEIFFAESLNGNPGLILGAGAAEVTLSSDIGTSTPMQFLEVSSAGNVVIQDVMVVDSISIYPHITLSQTPLTTFTSQSSKNILLGSIDGTTTGSQNFDIVTSRGDITLGVIGANVPLGEILITTGNQVSIHSMTTVGAITITIPITLLDSSVLNASNTITLDRINGSTVGGQALTINAGTSEVVLQGDIGTIISPGDLDVTGGALYLENASIFTNGMQQYHSPVLVAQDIVFRSKGNITFDEMVDPVSDPSNLSLYPGGGTLTFASSVGDAPFGDVGVFNAGSFVAQDIFASTLTVSGGLASVYLEGNTFLSGEGGIMLDAGPIFFGGSIEAQFLFFRSNGGNITNLGSPVPITSTGSTFLDLSLFNAIDGVIGSKESPVEINTPRLLFVGADPRADFMGDPMHNIVRLIRRNRPCTVVFNGVTIINCDSQFPSIREIFHSIAKDLFYVPGLYSSWDNLSNLEYFQQEPVDLGFNPRDRKLFYSIGPAEKRSLITQILSGCTRLQKVEEEILQGKTLKPELVSWDFSVDLFDEKFFLDLLPLSK